MNDRFYKRGKLVASGEFVRAVSAVVNVLEARNIPYALIGGIAVAHYANPPVTIDVDFLADMNKQQAMHVLQQVLKAPGWEGHPIRIGKREHQPRMGIFFFPPGEKLRVDVLAAKGEPYLEEVIERSQVQLVASKIELPVVTPEDLVILKTMAGRDKDVEDVIALYHVIGTRLDHAYIQERLDEFGYQGFVE